MKFHLFPGAISRCEIAPSSSLRRFAKEVLFAASFIAAIAAGTANSDANVVATITVGVNPNGVAVTPDGSAAYVANSGSNTVSVIKAQSVVATIPVGNTPMFVALTPDDTTAFVTNNKDNTVSVISTATNTVTDTIPVGLAPWGLAVKPDGTKLWVCNRGTGNSDGTVSVIDVATHKTVRTIPIPVGQSPLYVLFSPDSLKAHVLNQVDLAPTGTHVQGYLTELDAAKGRIIAERTFTQENTPPLGMAFSPRRVGEIYISCLPAESSLVRIGYQGTFTTPVYDRGPNFRNPGSYIGGIDSRGTLYKRSYVIIANTGVNTLVRKTQKLSGRGASRSVHLGEHSKPLYVAASAGYVFATNPSSGTVSIVDLAVRK
jgi:YVTN family beta-propeller protein